MSFTQYEPIASGVLYPVTVVADDEQPGSLDQFVGDARFTIQVRAEYVVQGTGSFDGKSVRFYEKDGGGSGKDIRVWRITAGQNGGFQAQHEAAF